MLKRALSTRFAIGLLLFVICTMAILTSCAKNPGNTSDSALKERPPKQINSSLMPKSDCWN